MDLHILGYHKGGIETQTKLANDLVGIFGILEFLHKLRGSRKCNLVDVFFDFLSSHAEPLVGDGDGLLLFIKGYLHREIA